MNTVGDLGKLADNDPLHYLIQRTTRGKPFDGIH